MAIRCSIGETIYFDDLQILALFSQDGPGRDATHLLRIQCTMLSYLVRLRLGFYYIIECRLRSTLLAIVYLPLGDHGSSRLGFI